MASAYTDARPLIAHVVYRFDVGGLENGVVNLINKLPANRYRHAVIALTQVTEFRRRIERDDVQFIALDKPAGHGIWLAPRMRRLLREMRPTIVHTRNLAALEMSLPAAWAGVPVRIHGEHGWDVNDPDGRNLRHGLIRRLYRPFVHHYIALSKHQARYLIHRTGVAPQRVAQIYNGVDLQRFQPAIGGRGAIAGAPFQSPDLRIVGAVGRLHPIKDQLLLARAFVRAVALSPEAKARMRLVIAGAGPLAEQIDTVLREAGADKLAWLAGPRDDVAEVMRGLDCFVLPSRAEGISNTILEAMASGLSIIATDVGGNGELLEDGVTGQLVPAQNVEAMAQALLAEFADPVAARNRGQAALTVARRDFGLDRMVAAYAQLYDSQMAKASPHGAPGSLPHRAN